MNESFSPKGWINIVKVDKLTGCRKTVFNNRNGLTGRVLEAIAGLWTGTTSWYNGWNQNNLNRGLRIDGMAWGSLSLGSLGNGVTGSWAGTFSFGTNPNFQMSMNPMPCITMNFIATFGFSGVATVDYMALGQGSIWAAYYSYGTQCHADGVFAFKVLGTDSTVYQVSDLMVVNWTIHLGTYL